MGTAIAEPTRKLLAVSDIARATGLAEETIRGHLDRREWPAVQVGTRRCWRIPAAVLDCLLAGRDPSTLRS